jgi:hypothetical protein
LTDKPDIYLPAAPGAEALIIWPCEAGDNEGQFDAVVDRCPIVAWRIAQEEEDDPIGYPVLTSGAVGPRHTSFIPVSDGSL